MKKSALLVFCFLLLCGSVLAQTHQRGHGAASIDELGQSVFNALKNNQFSSLNNYIPDEVELRILQRRSSRDMRAILEQISPDTIKQTLQTDFNAIITQATAKTLNWNNWQLSTTKATQIDKKNRLLYRVQLSIATMEGQEKQILFEAIRIRNKYFLFKQLVLQPDKQAG